MEIDTNDTAPCDLLRKEAPEALPTAIVSAMGALAGKWKMPLLWLLWRRTHRFGELRRALPGITQHMLTARLRELEADGLVTRSVFPEVPPRVEYALTNRGLELGPVFHALRAWGANGESVGGSR